jgi:hypothetical protein
MKWKCVYCDYEIEEKDDDNFVPMEIGYHMGGHCKVKQNPYVNGSKLVYVVVEGDEK